MQVQQHIPCAMYTVYTAIRRKVPTGWAVTFAQLSSVADCSQLAVAKIELVISL